MLKPLARASPTAYGRTPCARSARGRPDARRGSPAPAASPPRTGARVRHQPPPRNRAVVPREHLAQLVEGSKASGQGDERVRELRHLGLALVHRRDDAQVVAVIEKMLKQRRDSISQYEAANRHDLADVEKFEMTVLQTYMPQQLSDAEISEAVAQAIATSGAASAQDMGKVMAILKPQLAGRADIGKVSALVKATLSK